MTVQYRYGLDSRYGRCSIGRCLETIRFWEEGIKPAELAQKVLTEAADVTKTVNTSKHFIREFFAHRFMTEEGLPWTRVLKRYSYCMDSSLIVQIMYLLSARFDPMLRDFVMTFYWPQVMSGCMIFPESVLSVFLEMAAREGRPGAVWTVVGFSRLKGALGGICTGFGLWRKEKKNYVVAPFRLHPDMVLLLACELHNRGLSDEEVVSHRDWIILGLNRGKVIQELKSSRYTNAFLVQSSGDLVNISWRKTMMEAAARYDK